MINPRYAWPNMNCPGEPLTPTQTGPHALVDKNGKRAWAWWIYHSSGASIWILAGYQGLQTGPSGLVREGFSYLGPAIMPCSRGAAR